MKILFIQYDNDDYVSYFPCNYAALIAYIKQHMPEAQCIVYNQDLYHYPEEHLKRYIEKVNPDFVCLGSVAGYYPYKKLKIISDTVNKCSNRKDFQFVLGGYIVSPDPDYFKNYMGSDSVIAGEGETKLLNILKGGVLKEEKLLNLEKLPLPAYHYFNIPLYRLIRYPNVNKSQFAFPIFSGRGCPYKCTFCYRMYEGLRLFSVGYIEENIRLLHENYDITYFMFYDELTMCSTKRIMDICDMIDKLGFKINWACNGRLNIVTKEILERMKDTGCVFINYGIESLDDQVLENMKKRLTEDVIIKGVEATLESGISPGLNIIWGNKGDSITTLMKGVRFLLKYDDGAQRRTIRPVTPYPGCELYYDAIRDGKLEGVEDFYNKHLNSEFLTVNYTDLSDDEFHNALYKANLVLTQNYNSRLNSNLKKQLKNLYIKKDATFRGFR